MITILCFAMLSACTEPENDEVTRGAICGIPGVEGQSIDSIKGEISGCGVENPVQITAVAGVNLSQAATMDCETAGALHSWVTETAKPAVGKRGGGLASLRVAAHYACRSRNNQKGARISEHGKGKAIDISAFILKNDEVITVLKGWNSAADKSILRKMHQGACGPFGTVLGPDSDRFHKNHLHFDTASYRSGPYCR